MFAVLINGLATSGGALLGILLKKGIPQHLSQALYAVMGLGLLVVAIQGAIQTENPLLLLVSGAVGAGTGTALRIEDRLQAAGVWLQQRLRADGSSQFAEAFVSLSIMQIVGAMAILGPLQAALLGDSTLLYLKSTVDGVSAFIFGAIYGAGAVPVGLAVVLYEAAMYLLASLIAPLMTPDVVRELGAVGNVMILAIALNMLGLTKLKVADYLPAVIIPVIYYHIVVLL